MTTWLDCRALAFAAVLAVLPEARAGTLNDVQFTAYTPLSGNLELARRLLSPLTAAKIPHLLAQSSAALSAQPIDLSHERFLLYVPSRAPPNGYALLVFVPPWDEARLPDGWADVLDRYGMIFVSADRSGNSQSVLGRREPLALLAEQNVVARYRVDASRIFIGGFSGGSRVASRLALGYPDVFRGAFLDAGSDPIGNAATPLPPRDLLRRFQEFSHLVYVTGEEDVANLGQAAVSKRTMQDWCVAHVDTELIPGGFHGAADPDAFSRALAKLMEPVRPDPDGLAACRAPIESRLSQELRKVDGLVAQGDRDAAQNLLNDIDGRFGGLAAPRSVELQQQIDRMPK